MRFQREKVYDLWSEVMPLLEAHYREIAHYQDIPLEPDRPLYEMAEASGSLRVFTARAGSHDALVGYAAYFVREHPHYVSLLNATMDVVFLLPAFRGNGLEFIAWCDSQLKAEGVETVTQHVKVKHDFSPMLERMGYEWVEKIMVRRLQVVARKEAA